MAGSKTFNLAIKVNDKDAKQTLNSVGKELKSLRSYTRNLEEGTDKWYAANKKLAETEKVYDGMKKKQREFINETKEATEETGNSKKAIQDFGDSFGKVTRGIMSGDLVMVQEGLRGMKAGIVAATKASIAFIATPLAATLAALALAIAAVTQYFRDSEEGQNAWNKIAAVTGAIVGNLTDLLSDLGKIIIDTFSNPKKAIIDLKNLIVENIENRITGLIKFFPRLGEAIDLALSGKFKEAGKVASDAVLQITTGVEGATDKITNSFDRAKNAVNSFGEEIASEAKRQAELADMAAEADKIERQLIIDRGKVEAQVAEARRKARDEENLSAKERQKLLDDAKAAQDELYEREIKAAEIRRQIKTEENSFSKSTKEDLNEEAQLIARVDQLRRQKADAGRNLMRDELRINNELAKAGQERAKADEQRIKQLDALEAEYIKKREDRLANSAVKQAELEQERALKKAEALGAEQELLDQIKAEHQVKIDEERAKEEEEELQRMRDFEAKKLELENELRLARAESEAEREEIQKEIDLEKEQAAYEKKMAQFEEEMARLEMTEEEKNQVLQSLKEAHEQTVLGIQKKYTDEKIKDEERLNAAKKKLWNDSLDAAINLAGQETKVGQALLIAKQIMAAKEMAVELGLFQNKATLLAAGASADIAAGEAKTAAAAPFPANIPLVLGFAAQVAGIVSAIKNAVQAKSKVKKSFAIGGDTTPFGMGYRDETGEEVAGVVHTEEYVVPKFVRKDPEVPAIIDYLETKRKKKLGLFATGGDTGATRADSGSIPMSSLNLSKVEQLLQDILEVSAENRPILFGSDAELKRQELERKLEKIKDRSKLKN